MQSYVNFPKPQNHFLAISLFSHTDKGNIGLTISMLMCENIFSEKMQTKPFDIINQTIYAPKRANIAKALKQAKGISSPMKKLFTQQNILTPQP